MNAPQSLLDLFERMRRHVAAGTLEYGPEASIPVANYSSEERLRREREVLFRRYPLVVGHDSELSPQSARAADVAGVPLLLTRDAEGRIRAFLNVCRHRGMRVLEEGAVCERRSLVCPYHGWTYRLDGSLGHYNHPEAFPGLRAGERGLVELPCALRHGLIWVLPTPGATLDLERYLGPIGPELEFMLGDSVLYRRVDLVRAANWKLIIDAFLDGYHIRVLHRDSLYRFFMDALAVSDRVGPHHRTVVGRRRASEAVDLPPDQWNLREHCSVTHCVFPNTVFIFHPDYASVISVFPVDTGHLRWVHQMLVPRAQHTEAARPHWEETFQLIEQTVFQREDLFAAEGIEAGLRSGANEALTVGRLEHPIGAFHANIEDALRRCPG